MWTLHFWFLDYKLNFYLILLLNGIGHDLQNVNWCLHCRRNKSHLRTKWKTSIITLGGDGSELHWVQTHRNHFRIGKYKGKRKKCIWPKIYFDVGVVYIWSTSHDPTDHGLTYRFWVSIFFRCAYTTLLPHSYPVESYFKDHSSKYNINTKININIYLYLFIYIIYLYIKWA